jgi:Tol biopolymer transport system component
MEESPEPAWSPDGANIAYASNDGIYAISAEGGQPRRITEIGTQPAWSPASDSIVFASESRLMRAPSRGGQPAYLTEPNNPPGKHDSPVWSNDGKHILFISRENAGDTIWSIGLADRALQKIPLPQGHYFSAVYSHDSKGIFYSEQTTDGLNHISIMLLDDDSPRPVELKVAGTTAQRGLRLSRDGRRLAYVLEPPAAVSGIYVVDLK